MPSPGQAPSSRIDLIDALRGSALFGILLLHSIEHWDFSRYPMNPPAWLKTLDGQTRDLGFFLFGGKAYAIFALMFGVSFILIFDRWSGRGMNFQGRFLWRLGVLAGFGYLHGLVYCGDILLIMAVLGLPLVLVQKLGSRALTLLAVLLVLQIPSLWEAGRVFFEPAYQPLQPRHWAIYDRLLETYEHGSLGEVLKTNLWQGQLSRIWWTIETGRYTQMMGLFIGGLLLARSRVWEDTGRCARLAKRALLWGVIGFAIFYPIKRHLGDLGLKDQRLYAVDNLVSSYCNLAQMGVWLGGFILLFQQARFASVLRLLVPFGRMSLTCYVTQGLVGVPVFYGFGLALYRYLGPFCSVLYGAAFFSVQCALAHWWLKRFQYGPLEWLWRCATFMTLKVPLRKPRQAAPSATARLSPSSA